MKKVVVESIYEYRELESLNFNEELNEEELNEEQLNELNLKSLAQNVKGFVSGQSGKSSLINFFNENKDIIASKGEIPDETINKVFPNVFVHTFKKYPKFSEVLQSKFNTAQKYQLLKAAKDTMDKNPKLDTPIILKTSDGKIKAGAIATRQASGTHGNA